MMTDGRKTPNGRTLFQDKVAAVLAEAIALGANAVEICVRDMRSDLRRRVDRDWYSIGEEWSDSDGRQAIQGLIDLRVEQDQEVKMDRVFHEFSVSPETLGLPGSILRLQCALGPHETLTGIAHHVVVIIH